MTGNQGGGRFGSKYMPGPEVENILSMQFRAVSGVPYTEDYYYQAFVYKYYEQRNKRVFAPESVRELNPTEKAAPGEVSFVKLEGLGKVPFSNIRRPRPLMDIATAPQPPVDGKKEGEGDGSDGDNKDPSATTTVRPLDQEPLLAARIMIEDCMCLVLDVLDVDAIFSAAKNGQEIENVEALRTRRALLLEGLAASMRLPDDALVDEEAEKKKKKKKKDSKKKKGEDDTAGTGGSIEAGDGVFLRLTTLPKGKALVARALKVIYPPPQSVGAVEGIEPNLRVLWAVMRNARALFGGRRVAAGKQEDDTAVSAKIATAMIDTISKLHSPQALCSTLEAAMYGDLYVDTKVLKANPEAVLLPLTPPSSSSGDKKEEELPWLKDVITALLTKAVELDIKGSVGDSPGKKDSNEIKQWYKDTERLYEVTVRHLSALSEALEAAKKMKEEEAIVEVKAMVPVKMGETLLEHCGKKKRKELDGVLQKVAK
jgi:DNA topoisomerase 2-associated protein PAT1